MPFSNSLPSQLRRWTSPLPHPEHGVHAEDRGTDAVRVDTARQRFAQPREDTHPISPDDHMSESMSPGWAPTADADVTELCWTTQCTNGTVEEQIWEWLREGLAPAGVYADEYYEGTRWGRDGKDKRTNANMTPKCDENTPAVRVRDLGITIQWYRSHDGRLRLDGSWSNKSVLLEMLRRSHHKYVRGATAQGRITGKQCTPRSSALTSNRTEQAERAKWDKARKNSVLVISSAEIYDGTGVNGVFDVLDDKIGVKNLPKPNTLPWIFSLNTGTLAQVFHDGRVVVTLGTGTVSAALDTESLFKRHFSAEDMTLAEYTGSYASSALTRVRYGVMGPQAKSRERFPGFRSGGMQSRTQHS